MGVASGVLIGGMVATSMLFLREASERGAAQWVADVLAEASGKPTINIGCKRDKWGSVRCDINPQGGAVYGDACHLDFPDKTFSVAMLSHVLEHVEDPEQVLLEAHRIADEVIAIVPNAFNVNTWLSPEHRWVFVGGSLVENQPALFATVIATLGAAAIIGVAAKASQNRR